MTATKEPMRDNATQMLLHNTRDVLRAFMECSDEIQKGVLDMVQILDDPNADEDQKIAAADTLVEALYPHYVGDELGIDLEAYVDGKRKNQPEIEEELDAEEETFASRLTAQMEKKGMTQQELAERINVGQPAISMMLRRECRPQRRTVERIAKALGIPVDQLWPKKK